MVRNSFVLRGGSGVLAVNEIHKISQERCHLAGTKRAVLLAKVQKGILREGDEVVLENGQGGKLSDVVGRLEVKCRHYPEVGEGADVGVLLINNSPEELTKFGLPLHNVGHSRDKHP